MGVLVVVFRWQDEHMLPWRPKRSGEHRCGQDRPGEEREREGRARRGHEGGWGEKGASAENKWRPVGQLRAGGGGLRRGRSQVGTVAVRKGQV